MILLSNYIKSANVVGAKTIIIQTKQIKLPHSSIVQQELPEDTAEIDPLEQLEEKKRQLEDEIEALVVQKHNLQHELNEMKAQAQDEIASWWAEKEVEMEELFQQEREKAAEQGYQEGYQQGLKEMEGKINEARRVLESAYLEKEKIIQEAEPFLLALSVHIAEKIVRKKLAEEESIWLEMIKSELKNVRERGEITIEVPTNQYQYLLAHKDELVNSIPAEVELKMVPYLSSNPHGCLIHTPSGSYDVTIDHQLSEIKKQLLGYYQEKQHEQD